MSQDITTIRAKFPALQQNQVFLDNAGGSQILGVVADSIRDYLINTNVQLGASYKIGQSSTRLVNQGFKSGAQYINAHQDEIVFGASSTQILRNFALGLTFARGDEIIVSLLDHEANIAPWIDLAERQDLCIKWWKPEDRENPKLTVDNLKPLLSSKTRLVAFTHCSNVLGTIHDVKAITSAAHEYPNVLVVVDGVAYAPHRPIDVKDLGVDAYCFSWYKVFGPHIAMLYASRETQKQIRPLGHYFNPTETLADKAGFSAGSYELIASIPILVDHLLSEGWEASTKQESEIQSLLLDYLNKREDVTIYGEKSTDFNIRVPTISFKIKEWGSKEIIHAIEEKTNLAFRYGSFYSQRLVRDIFELDPLDGIVRVSMAHYNTRDEIEAVIAALEEIVVKR